MVSMNKKIKEIDIGNFRAYKDLQRFNFTYDNGRKIADLVAIYAPNGYGKTSFFDAIEWAVTDKIGRLEGGKPVEEEIACSRRTIYSYIDSGVFEVRNMDLRRKVVYKPRKKKTATSTKDRAFRKDRGYKEFQEYINKNKPTYIVEMDTVEGVKGTKPCFLTMLFRNCKLMLMFLLKEQTQDEVNKVFDYLTEVLGIELFQKLFEVIITDNGHEFQDRWNLECDDNGEMRTRIYYCDPNRSDQKGALEKNHEYIRYVLPKGTSFENMTEETTLLLLNHINSEKRDSLNGHSPYEVSRILLDNRLHEALGLIEIPADEVTLIPALVK